MSYQWAAADEITAARLLRTGKSIHSCTSGEAIDASSTPIAVFFDSADNSEAKIADSGADATAIFHGFVDGAQNVGDNVAVFVNTGQFVDGFSGLTAGDDIYLSTSGAIANTAGTVELPIGQAISTTEIWVPPTRKIAQGQGTRTSGEGAGNETITHNLGVLPRLIKIVFTAYRSSSQAAMTTGVGTANGPASESCIWNKEDKFQINPLGQTAGQIIHTEFSNGTAAWEATVSSVTPTTVVLNFGTASDHTLYYQYEIHG
tara:strand:- start:515 stop:1294 length:780 start_codon:yes stop_codon:yes gene_type:complete